MLGTIILIILLVLGLFILAWIFLRKLPQVRMVDPSSSKESRSRALKYDIMRQRVERSTGKQMDKVQKGVIDPIGKGFQNIVRSVAGKLTAVERSYQERRNQSGDSNATKDQLDKLVEDGTKLMDEEHWDRAEKKFIEVISNDPKNQVAYERLGRLYQYKKDYKLAKQTFLFLKKLAPSDPSVIASLGEVEIKLGNPTRALKYFKQAVKHSPKNPKYLDLLITASIEEGDSSEAKLAVHMLKSVNPDNKKIPDFEDQIKKIK